MDIVEWEWRAPAGRLGRSRTTTDQAAPGWKRNGKGTAWQYVDKTESPVATDKLEWKWRKGAATTLAAFGDPSDPEAGPAGSWRPCSTPGPPAKLASS